MVPLFFAILALNFMLLHLAPGNPLIYYVGEYDISPVLREELIRRFGLDKSIGEQFLIYLRSMMTGDLGFSYINNTPVVELILERLPATVLLMGTQFILSTIIGIFLGVYAAYKQYSHLDRLLTVITVAFYSIPVFVLGQTLILIFAIHLEIFPATGLTSLRQDLGGVEYIVDVLRHLVLPVFTLTAINTCLIFRLTRGNMLMQLGKEYITAALSRGASDRLVLLKHALKNALLPVVTIVNTRFSFMLAGTVLVEAIFDFPGIGSLVWAASSKRDYPVLMGIWVFVSISVMFTCLVTDIIYAYLDPRVKYK